MNFEIFENLDFSNIENLYNLCLENQNNLSLIKNLYSRDNKHLQETINFLIELNIINIHNNSVSIKTTKKFHTLLLEQLRIEPKYSLTLKNYLQNFLSSENKIVNFKPDLGYNILSSGLRNLLISAKIIKHNIKEDEYELLDHNLLNEIKNSEFSPEQLALEIKKQNELGLAAEKLVFNYELKKLLKIDKKLKPDHISQRDVSAGFDIKSYAMIDGKVIEIFIEVKAVSSSNYKFHLRPGEYQKAISNLENYYLYLLPVDYSLEENFNYSKILKINNLQSNIFENKNYWSYQNDGFIVFKKN